MICACLQPDKRFRFGLYPIGRLCGTHKGFPVSAKDPNMKNITVLGGAPGIAHTGVSVIKTKAVGYSLITAETLKTSARDETENIGQQHINELLQIQALFDAWGVWLSRCNRLSGRRLCMKSSRTRFNSSAKSAQRLFSKERGKISPIALWQRSHP